MKNKSIVLFLLLMNTPFHAMENNPKIDYKIIHRLLRDDYQRHAINRLIEYNKKDTLDMSQLIEDGTRITGTPDAIEQLLHPNIKDENDNRFIHIAIQKADINLIEWLLNQGDINCIYMNTKQEYPLDICIKQLLPTVIDTGEKARQIFDLLIRYIAALSEEHDSFKYRCLKKIIALQLKHKRHNNTHFPVDEELLQSLVPRIQRTQQPSALSLLYIETTDNIDGNTWSHILVEQENPDALYELALNNQISWGENNNKHTALDIAAMRFREAVQGMGMINANKESFDKRKCCLFILSHYFRNIDIKNGAKNVELIGICCTDKHLFQ